MQHECFIVISPNRHWVKTASTLARDICIIYVFAKTVEETCNDRSRDLTSAFMSVSKVKFPDPCQCCLIELAFISDKNYLITLS